VQVVGLEGIHDREAVGTSDFTNIIFRHTQNCAAVISEQSGSRKGATQKEISSIILKGKPSLLTVYDYGHGSLLDTDFLSAQIILQVIRKNNLL
jgi:hypothetical protein